MDELIRHLLRPLRLLPALPSVLLNLAIAMLGGAVFAVTFKLLGGLDEDDKRRLARLKLPLPPWVLRWL